MRKTRLFVLIGILVLEIAVAAVVFKPWDRTLPEAVVEQDPALKDKSCFLVVGVDGATITTRSMDSGVYFDHKGSGFRIQTAWPGASCGLLARDLDGNGIIDSGRELFGDNTLLKDGTLAANGFEALRDLDEHRDGLIDARDSAYSELSLWIDKNGNGETDEGELTSLSDMDIVSINLSFAESDYIDPQDSYFRETSTALLADESAADVANVWCTRNLVYSKPVRQVEVSKEVRALPEIRSYGKVYSLQQTVMLDESGRLKTLLEQFIEEQDEWARRKLTKEILYQWTGASSNLEVLEKLTGVEYVGGTGPNAMAIIDKGFESNLDTIHEVLMSQTHYFYLYNQMTYYDGKYYLTLVANPLLKAISEDQEKGELLLIHFLYNLQKLDPQNDFEGKKFFQFALGSEDERCGVIGGMLDRNILFGAEGGGHLTGIDGHNAFVCDSGDNTLEAGDGDDIYYFHESMGVNTITDTGGENVILLLGIQADEIQVAETPQTDDSIDVVITFANQRGTLTLCNYTTDVLYTLIATNGTQLDLAQCLAASKG